MPDFRVPTHLEDWRNMTKMRKRRTDRAVTTKDIADATGLSKMTVSRVLNDHKYVSAATRKKVEQAVKKLGFRPNMLAKRFFTGRTQLIGLIIPLEFMFRSFYFKEVFQGVLDYAEESGYDILIHDSTSRRKPAIDKCRDLVQGKLVEGLLLAAPMDFDTYPLTLTKESIPLVVMGETACGSKVNRVLVSNRLGSRDAVEKLIAAGHKKIAILTFDDSHMESKERYAGYEEALRGAGIKIDKKLVIPARYDRMTAFKAIEDLMSRRKDVTAVYAINADMALGAADAMRAAGIAIPRRASIVSFDDSTEIAGYDPPISAVRQDPYKVGHGACEMLIALLTEKDKITEPLTREVGTEYIERGSVAPPGK